MDNVDSLITKYYSTRNVDLYNDLLDLGVDENFMTNAPIELNDPTITNEREKEISDILRKFTRPKTKELLDKYDDNVLNVIDENALQTQNQTQPTGINTFEKNGKTFIDKGQYAFEIINAVEQPNPYLKNVGTNQNGTSKWNKMTKTDISTYNTNIALEEEKQQGDNLMSNDVETPIKVKNSNIIPDGETFIFYNKNYIRHGDDGYEIQADGTENATPSMYFIDGIKRKKGLNPAYVVPPVITAPTIPDPTIGGIGLKKSLNTDKIMKILKKLQMKKITGGSFQQPNYDKIKFMKDIKKENIKGGMLSKNAAQKYALEYYRR